MKHLELTGTIKYTFGKKPISDEISYVGSIINELSENNIIDNLELGSEGLNYVFTFTCTPKKTEYPEYSTTNLKNTKIIYD